MVSYSDAQLAAQSLLAEGGPRYACLAGGTRSGKTFLIVRAILERAETAPGSTHAILRLHANAAKASISQETIPAVRRLCFPALDLAEHRTDQVWSLKNGSRITVGGLDDAGRVERILGLEYSTVFLNGTCTTGEKNRRFKVIRDIGATTSSPFGRGVKGRR